MVSVSRNIIQAIADGIHATVPFIGAYLVQEHDLFVPPATEPISPLNLAFHGEISDLCGHEWAASLVSLPPDSEESYSRKVTCHVLQCELVDGMETLRVLGLKEILHRPQAYTFFCRCDWIFLWLHNLNFPANT